MIASVHLSDLSAARNPRRRIPKPETTNGMRWSHRILAGQPSPSAIPAVQLARGGMVAWWDDDAALDAFLSGPAPEWMHSSWSVRLRPTRSRAMWPKMDVDPFPQPNERHDGLHVAITLGTARAARLPKFLKVSSALEGQFLDDPNGVWGLACALPPLIVMTMTFWTDQDATDAYTHSGAHGAAMREHYDFRTDDHTFVSDGGFYGFQPYAFAGRLTGTNPTPDELSG